MEVEERGNIAMLPRVYYLGSPSQVEATGGQKYMNEVIDFLGRNADLVVWDPARSGTLEDRVNRLGLQAIRSQVRSNTWGIKELRAAQEGEIIVINSYLRHRFLLFALWARWVHRCKVVVFVNAIYHHSRGSRLLNALDCLITRLLLWSATIIIANSRSTSEELCRMGVRGDAIQVIYPRLDMPPMVQPADGKESDVFHILFVGYCEPFKELHVLIRAIGRLHSVPLRLHVIGDNQCDPQYSSRISKLIGDLHVTDRVIFHGRMGRAELAEWLQRADLFVSPSRGEGYGRALAEAMYFGLPAIGADRGASKELIEHGTTGFLFQSGNDESLASRILALYQDQQLARRFGARAREFIRQKANYDQNVGAQFYSILTTLCEAERSHAP
jgi:glycosyltransferase involved in cell wall biosynthesis